MSEIVAVEMGKLREYPGNPNRMSEGNFRKLVRNIERTGKYEPIVVRPREGGEYFEIINGHHRVKALEKLGYKEADCVVWDVDDEEMDVLLSTLNRLGGTDVIERKRELLKRLSERMRGGELAKILPGTRGQIERLINFSAELPIVEGEASMEKPVVFFVDGEQKEIIEGAIEKASEKINEKNKAKKRAKAIVEICKLYVGKSEK